MQLLQRLPQGGGDPALLPPISAWERSGAHPITQCDPIDEPAPRTAKGPWRAPLTGAQAAFLFGLHSVRGGVFNPQGPALIHGLSCATGEECLNIAFALAKGGTAKELHAAAKGEITPPPFTDRDYYRAIAQWLGAAYDDGAEFLHAIRSRTVTYLKLTPSGGALRFVEGRNGHAVIAPAADWLPGLAVMLLRTPQAREQLTVAPPSLLAAATESPGAKVSRGRTNPLHAVPPIEVAERVVSRSQATSLAAAAGTASAVTLVAPLTVFVISIILVTTVLLAYTASRALALFLPEPPPPPRHRLTDRQLPVYTILVPLYREERTVGGLIDALKGLDYPPQKLDIIFLLEADDGKTRAAIERAARDIHCRIAVLPEGKPQTKPRALNVGLRQARGQIVTIYDAEDRPDPNQLRIAAETFTAAPLTLAGVQARLSIDHMSDNWLTKMFAIEYACLFDRLLPMVAGRGRLMLLGGTSNHFRKDALIEVGGWDPYNVTEDADLSVRLRRRGYILAMIDSETTEEAPLTVKAWVKQRSRWFKGYMQTWLVHNREPRALWRDIGPADTALLHLFIVGAFAAALAHNVFFINITLALLDVAPLFGGDVSWLIALQGGIALASYAVNIALGAYCMRLRGNTSVSPFWVILLPLYWVLMGWAVVLALYDLVKRPHHWRKTTHGLAARPAARAAGAPPNFAG